MIFHLFQFLRLTCVYSVVYMTLLYYIYCLAAYRLVIKFCVFHIILISWSNVRYCMHD
jgi:hypothetical protein